MNIAKNISDGKLVLCIEGRLDTSTAPDLEKEIQNSIDGISDLTFDFKDLEYISSAGLRVLLMAQKTMNKQGKMKVLNVNEEISEIFDITGFSDILDIE